MKWHFRVNILGKTETVSGLTVPDLRVTQLLVPQLSISGFLASLRFIEISLGSSGSF